VPKLLGGAERGAVQTCAARLARVQDDVGLEGPRAVRPRERDAARVGAEADQLCVAPRSRREALGPDVECLEEVGLAGAVRAGDEDDPGLERELEPRIRAEVPERDRADDQAGLAQPASRIGMIRYQKLSSGDTMRPGRSGLMSLSCTESVETASSPSRRKSGLKPISSGSPA